MTPPSPAILLPLERPLYTPVQKARLSPAIRVRDADEETDPAALFEQVYVDPEPLRGGVRQALRGQPQVGLAELVARYPIQPGRRGAGHLPVAAATTRSPSSTTNSTAIRSPGPTADGRERTATLPRVTYARRGG